MKANLLIIISHSSPDINECLLNGTVLCDTERTGRYCNDTSGSYQCTVCLEGYELTEDKQMCVGE